MFKITYFHYAFGTVSKKIFTSSLRDELIYVEDLLIEVLKSLNIGPVARHLFGFYYEYNSIWLACNQRLDELPSKYRSFELRVRFRPIKLECLQSIDQCAFNYFYCQVKDFFHQSDLSNNPEKLPDIFGLVITDILIHVIEKKIPIENALNFINFDQFMPIQFRKKSKQVVKLRSDDIMKNLKQSYHSCDCNSDLVKIEFVNGLIADENLLSPTMGVETYQVTFYTQNPNSLSCPSFPLHVFQFNPITLDLEVCSKNSPTKICRIEDVFLISTVDELTLEIARRNGISVYFALDSEFAVKSLLSLLDGYHRLAVKWDFNISSMVSPSSALRKANRVHGPVGMHFSISKLMAKGKLGTYLIRESEKEYNEWEIDVMLHEIVHFKVDISDGFSMGGIKYNTVAEMIKAMGEKIKLGYCIPPFESDVDPDHLLLCKRQSPPIANKYFDIPIIPPSHITDYQLLSNNNTYSVYKAQLKNSSSQNFVIIKAYKLENTTPFFSKLVKWIHLKSEFILQTFGMTISPPSLVREYCHLGPLDQYLSENRQVTKVVDLIECITYLAHALWFLSDNNIIHGRIRCASLFVSTHSDRCFKIKLSEPLGEINENIERAWIPPEYEGTDIDGMDVWAFGTTLWEVFSYGDKPPFNNVYNLLQPFACPTEIWNVIYQCWVADRNLRFTPQAIVRDLNQIFHTFYHHNRSRTHHYASVHSIDELHIKEELELESWVIDANSLKLGIGFNGNEEILGKGNYGEVVKAKYLTTNEFVAVKRIASSDRIKGMEKIFDMEREFGIMTQCLHDNIVKIIGIVKTPEIMLVMEFMELGSLEKYLRGLQNTEKDLSDEPFVKFALDISKGMEYLESKKIVHRDLAARNILLSGPNKVKISDFGLAQCLRGSESHYRIKTPRYLPFKWYAPESIKSAPIFSHKSDVWSYGITLWEIYSLGAEPIYPKHDNRDLTQLYELLQKGVRLAYPCQKVICPKSMYSLMRMCWSFNEQQRPSFSQIKSIITSLI